MAAPFSEAQAELLYGKKLDEALGILNEQGLNFRLVYTRDERNQDEVEARVIRVLKKEDGLEVLAGFFRIPRII